MEISDKVPSEAGKMEIPGVRSEYMRHGSGLSIEWR